MSDRPHLLNFDVEVTQVVRVRLDPAKFTPEFMAEFRRYFFPFDDLFEHAAHLAQLTARGVADLSPDAPKEFVEGYGPISEMGISAEIIDGDEHVIDAPAQPSTATEEA